MAVLGGFEAPPHLAVAVSGGADSMALCRLADDWALAKGGRVTALSVDHRLRADSAAECARVGGWLRRAGIDHHVLIWAGDKPSTGIQEAARHARYQLLKDWCRNAGARHLLLGHHRRDQAETVLYRLLRSSGQAGLAGMAMIVESGPVRLLRPLLGWPPAVLRALLRRWQWEWLEDPSNDDRRFARTRLRAAAASLATAGVTTDALLALAADAAGARVAMRDAVADLLAASCRVHPAGFARFDRRALAAAPAAVAGVALSRLLTAVGGSEHPPAAERVQALLSAMTRGRDAEGSAAATLGRCLIIGRGDELWLFRERRALPPERPLLPDDDRLWDGRFRIVWRPAGTNAPAAARRLRLRPYGEADARILRASVSPAVASLPHLARVTLPILCDGQGLAMAPWMRFVRPDLAKLPALIVQMAWSPRNSIADPGCFLNMRSSRII
ncbi:MAG TPA: tRNA lysidine(34) synthetase TilS [Rhodospirillales bacterium]|nr:tRNA lysidine(34) synthetase TilS [Rhodospirillales bacterium]